MTDRENEMKTTGAVITEIIEAYGNRFGQYIRIAEIAQARNLTPAEVADAITELMGSEGFTAEPLASNRDALEADQRYGPIIGGERRHVIFWQ
jgi:hypothetical protein